MKRLSKKAKAMKRGLAVFLAVLLMISSGPAAVAYAAAPGEGGAQTPESGETQTPGEGEIQTPGEGETQTPGGRETQTPGEGEIQTPGEGETQTPGSGETQTPGGGETQTPGSGETQTPGGGETQTPGSGETQTPGEGETQTPGSGETQKPGEGETQTPGSGETQTPGEGETQTPGSGETQTPGEGETQTPGSGETQKPGEGETQTPGSEEIKKPVEGIETEEEDKKVEVTEEVFFNTGNHIWQIVDEAAFIESEIGDGCFEEDGSYTIYIPEPNPLFPYEVQFIYEDEVTNYWFMSPDDSVEIGGHVFRVTADFDDSAVIQMSLNVGGDTIVIYPEEKEFTNDGDGASTYSLQPLEERWLRGIDLSAYTPAELTMVSVDYLFKNNETQNADHIVWTYNSYEEDGDYTVSTTGDKLDLSWGTCSGSTETWQMIVGSADQLDTGNIRYLMTIRTTDSENWLKPAVFTKDAAGNTAEISNLDGDYRDYWSSRDSGRELWIDMPSSQVDYTVRDYYIRLAVDSSVFSGTRYGSMKLFEGQFTSAAEAAAGTDITDALCNSGYAVKRYQEQWVTMVTYDNSGNVTGCLPFALYLQTENDGNYINTGSMFVREGSGRDYVSNTSRLMTESGCRYETCELYAEYPANGTYYLTMYYYQSGSSNPSAVTAAYAGQYDSVEQAVAAGAADIKASLFNNDYSTGGYAADYSQGVYFTIFAGQEIYHYCIKTETGTTSKYRLNGQTDVRFEGLKDAAGNDVKTYIADYGDDSYGDSNYRTILVENTVDLTKLAPVFTMAEGLNLYAGNELQVSGVSQHDFSGGAIQYSASAENKENARNYWLQVVPVGSGKRLYVNSLKDAGANTREENGIIYSTREMMLDGYHDYHHDILFVNAGTEDIENLAVELVSDNVVLDEYWTLNGSNKLSAVTTVDKQSGVNYGELSNLAKVRLRAKDETVQSGDVSGTLTVKSGSDVLMVLTLTGTIGDPCITTEEIPQAVKYVPYGVMIQNNNKYRWNKPTYRLLMNGSLPEGMSVMPNGELYGVPMEAGEFTFTVRMNNSQSSLKSSEKTYTLTVLENTDENVDGATDGGYDLSQRIQGNAITGNGSQTLVSQGQYSEFKYVYLDGVRLTEGTDYTSESGSTRITIRNQTLASTTGTHTIGVEFRMQDEDNTLKRAAQNYTVGNIVTPDPANPDDWNQNNWNTDDDYSEDNSDGGNSNDADSSDGSGSQGTSTAVSTGAPNRAGQNGGKTAAVNAEAPITYTIQSGDTLWKIAEKYYGSGIYWKKIYTDNTSVISNPDKIFAGQTILIYPIQETVDTVSATEGTSYTVEAGDTLWKIAQKVYGKGWQWRKIYQANRDQISEPGSIYVGQVIIIPEN